MINIPDFSSHVHRIMCERVIRETHLIPDFEYMMIYGYKLAMIDLSDKIKDVNKQITNKRKNNISC